MSDKNCSLIYLLYCCSIMTDALSVQVILNSSKVESSSKPTLSKESCSMVWRSGAILKITVEEEKNKWSKSFAKSGQLFLFFINSYLATKEDLHHFFSLFFCINFLHEYIYFCYASVLYHRKKSEVLNFMPTEHGTQSTGNMLPPSAYSLPNHTLYQLSGLSFLSLTTPEDSPKLTTANIQRIDLFPNKVGYVNDSSQGYRWSSYNM